MPPTKIRGSTQIKDNTIQKHNIDVITASEALITSVESGPGIYLESTGTDEGTGDVIISTSGYTTGFLNRTSSAITISGTLVTIAPSGGSSFDIFSYGEEFNKTGGSSCQTTITSASGLHYVYFNASGVLQNDVNKWDIEGAGIPVCTVFWNGTAGSVCDERHGAKRNQAWHAWAHDTIGCRYESGLGQTYPDTSNSKIHLLGGYIHDEDIEYAISEQKRCRLWYEIAGGVWKWVNATDDGSGTYDRPYIWNSISSKLQYPKSDSSYALTDLTAAQYLVVWVYATTDIDRPIYILTSSKTAPYSNVASARSATPPSTAGLLTPEMKIIYKWIFRGDGVYQEGVDYRSSSSLPAGGSPSVSAAGVSFAPAGTIAATNVQTALEELDTEKLAASYYSNVESGTSFPGSPATGDLFYHTTLNILYEYVGGWLPITILANCTIYVDSTKSDTNDGASAANAKATVLGAIDAIPKSLNGFTVTINITAADYNESNTFNFDNGVVIVQGTLGAGTDYTATGGTAGTTGTSPTRGTVTKAAPNWPACRGKLIKAPTGAGDTDEYRIVSGLVTTTLTICGSFSNQTHNGDVVTLYDFGDCTCFQQTTTFSGTAVYQVYNIWFTGTGNTVCMSLSKLAGAAYFYNCCFYNAASTTYIILIANSSGPNQFQSCYIHGGSYGIYIFPYGYALVRGGCLIEDASADGIRANAHSVIYISSSSAYGIPGEIQGNGGWGVYVYNLSMSYYATYAYFDGNASGEHTAIAASFGVEA